MQTVGAVHVRQLVKFFTGGLHSQRFDELMIKPSVHVRHDVESRHVRHYVMGIPQDSHVAPGVR